MKRASKGAPAPPVADVDRPEPPTKRPAGWLARLHAVDALATAAAYGLTRAAIPRRLLLILEGLGSGLLWFPAAAAGWCLPDGATTPAARAACLALFIGLLLDLAAVGTLKAIARRPRPAHNAGDMHVTFAVDAFAFPSGHASRAVFLAVFARAAAYGGAVLPWAAAAAAAAVALSRIALGRHYVGDVAGGALLGAAVAAVTPAIVAADSEALRGALGGGMARAWAAVVQTS